ncbi:hypothetical protein WN55_02923 [Dufourea novaeangliae]|uniref:DUF4817 domain-containing protein n=1 Tax=Dufourea novaeangliae TaxID=178035 RepID=A0A154PIF5_DUFNO|nr:hypothetical protein WN55_02923 [Dufourea novaeangliae]
MDRYSTQQRILIVKHYLKNDKSLTVTIRKLRPIFGRQNVPSASIVKRIIEKFEKTGSIIDVKPSTRVRPSRSTENVTAVRQNAGNAQTVNGERYRGMITQFFVPQIDGMDLEDTWFQ